MVELLPGFVSTLNVDRDTKVPMRWLALPSENVVRTYTSGCTYFQNFLGQILPQKARLQM